MKKMIVAACACVALAGCIQLSPTSLQFGLSPSTLAFHAVAKGASPAAQTVSITDGAPTTLTGLATSVSYDSKGSGWLSVSLGSTSTPSTHHRPALPRYPGR